MMLVLKKSNNIVIVDIIKPTLELLLAIVPQIPYLNIISTTKYSKGTIIKSVKISEVWILAFFKKLKSNKVVENILYSMEYIPHKIVHIKNEKVISLNFIFLISKECFRINL